MKASAVICVCVAGEQAGRHLFLSTLRADRRQADRRHPGGQEPEEDGRRRTLRSVPAGSTASPASQC